jgi:hypothetical protein
MKHTNYNLFNVTTVVNKLIYGLINWFIFYTFKDYLSGIHVYHIQYVHEGDLEDSLNIRHKYYVKRFKYVKNF